MGFWQGVLLSLCVIAPVWAAGATMELEMGAAGTRRFEGVVLHGATFEKPRGLTFHVSPGAGLPARPLPAARIRSLVLSEEESQRTYTLLLSQPGGDFKRFEGVRLTQVLPGVVQAIPKGHAKSFPIRTDAIIHLEPDVKLEELKQDVWQVELSAQAFLTAGGRQTKPLTEKSRTTITRAQEEYSARSAAAPEAFASHNPAGLLGRSLPPLKLLGASGESHFVDTLRDGRPLVLVILRGFPGYVCPYCTAQTASLFNALPDFEQSGARVALVYPGAADTVPAFLRAVREYERNDAIPIPVFFDINLTTVQALGIQGKVAQPTTVILDRSGVVRYAYVGKGPGDRPPVGVLLAELSRLP